MNERVNALAGIATPAVLIDLDKVERNIKRLQDYADGCGLKVRPHIKTHKLPQIATMQLKAGAIGVTCQKISEPEAMVAATPEIRDVLITYNIIGAEKLDRLAALAKKVNLSVVADNERVIDGLRKRFVSEAKPLPVFIECNTGANRCGMATPEEAVILARRSAARSCPVNPVSSTDQRNTYLKPRAWSDGDVSPGWVYSGSECGALGALEEG